MGVQGLQAWLTARHSDVFVRACNPDFFDYVFIDLNDMLYDSLRIVGDSNYDAIYSHVFGQINNFTRNCRPTKELYIAVDGGAARAKLELQRRRRQSKGKKSSHSLMATPGTEFMLKLKEALRYYCATYVQKFGVKCLLSASDSPAEGEHKILRRIYEIAETEPLASFVISSCDGDVCLMAVASGLPNIYLNYRRGFRMFSAGEFALKLKKMCPDDDISRLRRDFSFIWILIGNDYLPKIRGVRLDWLWGRYTWLKKRMPQEYMIHESGEINWKFFLAYLASFGNYAFPYFGSFDTDWRKASRVVFERADGSVFEGMGVKVDVPEEQNEVILDDSDDDLKNKLKEEEEEEEDEKEEVEEEEEEEQVEAVVEEPIVENDVEPVHQVELLQNIQDVKIDATTGLGVYNDLIKAGVTKINVIRYPTDSQGTYNVKKYLEGILWCNHIFYTGVCSDYSYSYSYKRGPTIKEIFEYLIPHFSMKEWKIQCDVNAFDIEPNIKLPKSEHPAPTQLQALLYLMPAGRGDSLLPKTFQPLMNKEGNLVDLFHFHPFHVDTTRINEAINSASMTGLNPGLISQMQPIEITSSQTENKDYKPLYKPMYDETSKWYVSETERPEVHVPKQRLLKIAHDKLSYIAHLKSAPYQTGRGRGGRGRGRGGRGRGRGGNRGSSRGRGRGFSNDNMNVEPKVHNNM